MQKVRKTFRKCYIIIDKNLNRIFKQSSSLFYKINEKFRLNLKLFAQFLIFNENVPWLVVPMLCGNRVTYDRKKGHSASIGGRLVLEGGFY